MSLSLINNLLKHKLVSDQVSIIEVETVLKNLAKVIELDVAGDICEFGCYAGTTSLFISRFLHSSKSDKKLWVYDSFEGLPEKAKEDASSAGIEFKTGELMFSKKDFINNYKKAGLKLPMMKKGWFSELQRDDLPECVALAFLDGDYYNSVLDPLNLIKDRLSIGSVIIVDDYLNPKLPGASKALDEWLGANKINHKLSLVSDMAIVEIL